MIPKRSREACRPSPSSQVPWRAPYPALLRAWPTAAQLWWILRRRLIQISRGTAAGTHKWLVDLPWVRVAVAATEAWFKEWILCKVTIHSNLHWSKLKLILTTLSVRKTNLFKGHYRFAVRCRCHCLRDMIPRSRASIVLVKNHPPSTQILPQPGDILI